MSFFQLLSLPVILTLGALALGIGYLFVRTRYKKAGPDDALIIYGRARWLTKREGFRIVRGGGAFVWPAWEQYEFLSLKMMTLDIDLKHVYTIQGIPINVKAVAQVKVGSDTEHIRTAAEGFLGLQDDQIAATIKETVAGHLRGIVGTLTVEELYRDQKRFQEKVREEAHIDLEGMGFEFKSFVFREIQDDEGYLNALGQPKIQEALKNARIATANADRDAAIEEEQARQQKEQKRILVDTEIAQSDKSLSLKKAEIKEEVDVADAQAVKAGEMELKVQDIRIAEREVERQKLELNATIREQAEAKQFETERLADAAQYRVERQAAADRKRREEQAEALKAEGRAKAEAESAQRRQIGLAEAEAIQARGEAEALARRKLAEALKLYNEAGLSIEALKVLPEIAAAVAEPLSRAGETTIISQGGSDGAGTGASKLTEDVTSVLSQLTPVMEQLSGVDLKAFLRDVSKLPSAVVQRAEGGDAGETAPGEEATESGES
ncbi:MAG: SPFH domain-containing protein [Thermoanaerobaculia bacterium]|nr:SPFH domain-containing protein [Thermoanaerobaculia bacterium]